ncbi:hypothetical protein [Haloterrigena alkaliphila]|uniref:Uncharacterized protein n=1 Tax=Haloterrigena alkaliphila TaxID=2816475 RepID=A0A8A2VHW1_9EURY|nr:hypothetical protein [Haloterrigena alkaliphila]QSX01112.1 hypothetical protein J0X25_09235 [Haloterrigena alkaliphila]
MATDEAEEYWIRTSIDDLQSALLLGDNSTDVSKKLLEMMNTYAPIWREVYIIDEKSDDSITSTIQSGDSSVSHNISWIDSFDNMGTKGVFEELRLEIESIQAPSHIDTVFFVNATTIEKYLSRYEITEIIEQIQSMSDFTYIYADLNELSQNSLDYLTSTVDQVATYNSSTNAWDKSISDVEDIS